MSDIYNRFSQFVHSLAEAGIRVKDMTITLPTEEHRALALTLMQDFPYEATFTKQRELLDEKVFCLSTVWGTIKFIKDEKSKPVEPPRYDENAIEFKPLCEHEWSLAFVMGFKRFYRCTKCSDVIARW